MAPPKTVHLDIVDYPGEWLLDLGLLDLTYDQWSKQALQAAQGRVQADAFCRKLKAVDGAKPFDDVSASELAKAYAAYLTAARHAGFSNLTPGRMLLPGDLARIARIDLCAFAQWRGRQAVLACGNAAAV